MTGMIRMIEINKIEPNGRCVYDADGIDAMMVDIRINGQLEPIHIWFAGRLFRILDGEKRWRACKKLGMVTTKAVVEDIV
jgi:ParB family chromosome partitioning protein